MPNKKRNNHRRRSPKKGGALIGKGGFGCVFDNTTEQLDGICPSVDLRPDVQYAVKVIQGGSDFTAKKTEKEIKITKTLGDQEELEGYPVGTFFIGSEAMCAASDTTNANVRKSKDECNRNKPIIKSSNVFLIFTPIIKNAVDYEYFDWNKVEEHNILRIWLHLFKGLKLMKDVYVVHNDIKQDNILFDENDIEHPKYIDFGQSEIDLTYDDFITAKRSNEAAKQILFRVEKGDAIALAELISNKAFMDYPEYKKAYESVQPELDLIMESIEKDSETNTWEINNIMYKLEELIQQE